MASLISIIIPTLNEEKNIVKLLKHVRNLPGKKEIIVVDGGSQDSTLALASGLADKVIETRKGRGHQLNEGAMQAVGDILFFLHSDCYLEKNALLAISTSLNNTDAVGGAFQLVIDDPSWLLKFISWTSNLRARYLKLIFGDQGIFVRRAVFEQMGGFPEIELMEDWEFSRSLFQQGKVVFLKERIYTSSRRWRKYGVLKTILLMHKIKLLYLMGVEPERLNQIYRDAR